MAKKASKRTTRKRIDLGDELVFGDGIGMPHGQSYTRDLLRAEIQHRLDGFPTKAIGMVLDVVQKHQLRLKNIESAAPCSAGDTDG